MHDPRLIEAMARAIILSDEQNGGPCWEYLMQMGKHVTGPINDRAEAALTALCAARPDVAALLRGEAVAVPRGFWETLWNGHNCVIHEEDNEPPSAENAVRISRNTLAEAGAMLAASPYAQENKP